MKFRFFKILFSLVVFTYVFSTVGVCLIGHYCGGELEKISLFSKPSSCCGGEEEEETDGCCRNDVKHVAFQKDFPFYEVVTDCKAPSLELFIIPQNVINFHIEEISQSIFLYNRKVHPPNLVQRDIVSCSVLRI